MPARPKSHRPPPDAPPPARSRIVAWISARAAPLCLVAIAIASLRIAATYTVFSPTIDEPIHVACGMEWLAAGTYKLEAQHPPLSRIMAAAGPYLAGRRPAGHPEVTLEGHAIVYEGGVDLTMALARAGNLAFFWIACAVVWFWARRSFGEPTASIAVFLFSLLPPVLAHAGLATTDMALTAMFGAAFVTGWMWLERPNRRRGILFGAAAGLMVLSKFSSFLFLPACGLACLAWYAAAVRPRPRTMAAVARERALPFALAAVVGFFVVWAGYRFSFGPSALTAFAVPAPELLNGIHEVAFHNKLGHTSYLLGERSQYGFWYYYPVVLAVKTPLAFLALAGFGIVLCWRRRREAACFVPPAFIAGVMAVGFYSSINIGVRHILPVYLALSVVAAAAVVRLLELMPARAYAKAFLAVAAVWLTAGSALAHPDYLPYTNALAGSEPERVLADSDLDWGQDMKRLGKRLRELGASEATLVPFFPLRPEAFGIPPLKEQFSPVQPNPGWNAISITAWKVSRLGLKDQYPNLTLWPDAIRVKPRERVGKSILLWYFPPAPGLPDATPAR